MEHSKRTGKSWTWGRRLEDPESGRRKFPCLPGPLSHLSQCCPFPCKPAKHEEQELYSFPPHTKTYCKLNAKYTTWNFPCHLCLYYPSVVFQVEYVETIAAMTPTHGRALSVAFQRGNFSDLWPYPCTFSKRVLAEHLIYLRLFDITVIPWKKHLFYGCPLHGRKGELVAALPQPAL